MGKKKQFFARSELKYVMSIETKEKIIEEIKKHIVQDEYGESLICGIYFDTPDFLLIRRSIEKPVYKEKFRVRCYGIPNDESKIFLEIKKKFKGITYKRRISTKKKKLSVYLNDLDKLSSVNQVGREMAYMFKLYKDLGPAMYISYEREAFFDKNNKNFRITFDRNITCRDYDLDLSKGSYGYKIIDENMCIMELKVDYAIPMWMVKILSENKVYKTSFSKYGTAYRMKMSGGMSCVG